jgi:hypothetical protein
MTSHGLQAAVPPLGTTPRGPAFFAGKFRTGPAPSPAGPRHVATESRIPLRRDLHMVSDCGRRSATYFSDLRRRDAPPVHLHPLPVGSRAPRVLHCTLSHRHPQVFCPSNSLGHKHPGSAGGGLSGSSRGSRSRKQTAADIRAGGIVPPVCVSAQETLGGRRPKGAPLARSRVPGEDSTFRRPVVRGPRAPLAPGGGRKGRRGIADQ